MTLSSPLLSHSRRGSVAWLLIYALWILSPNFVWLTQCNGRHFADSIPYALMSGLLPSLVALVMLFGVCARRLWVGCMLLLPFLPLIPVEIAYIVHYHEPTWYAIIATSFESNSHEIIDFLGAAIWPLLLACVLSTLFGVVIVVHARHARLVWVDRTRAWALIACTTIVVLFAFREWRAHESQDVRSTSSMRSTTTSSERRLPAWTADIEPSFPIGVPVRFMHYREEWNAIRAHTQKLASFRFGTYPIKHFAQRQIYVLVVGETGRRDHWQLYGYPRPTNPELLKIPNLILFTHMITPAGESRDSVPMIVSRKPATDHAPFYSERSITAAFSEAGFDTYWLSNQMAIGHFDSPIAAVAYDAAHVSFYSVTDWDHPGTYDEVLLNPLREAIRQSSKDLLVVLHTMGSHSNYANRYPEAFDVFTPSLKGVSEPDYYDLSLHERLLNSYDNSILYTDHFLSEVIHTLASTDAISALWYVSDHGEDFASATCKLAGHGNGTTNDFRIPSFFWYSTAYAAADADALAQIRLHSTMKMTTEVIAESLVDMAGLDFPSHDQTRSIFSPRWQERPRIVTVLGQFDLDFDAAAVSPKCKIMVPHRE